MYNVYIYIYIFVYNIYNINIHTIRVILFYDICVYNTFHRFCIGLFYSGELAEVYPELQHAYKMECFATTINT